jgi:hypothetical protein
MISRTPTLAEWPYRMVRLACDLCPRRGQYRKETLIARFSGDVLMPTFGTSSRNARERMRQVRLAACFMRICRREPVTEWQIVSERWTCLVWYGE